MTSLHRQRAHISRRAGGTALPAVCVALTWAAGQGWASGRSSPRSSEPAPDGAVERADDQLFADTCRQLVDELPCDRCFIYMRDPETRLGSVAYAHVRDPRWPTLLYDRWVVESPDYERIDPLFVAALRDPAPIYVDDLNTAPPGLLNHAHERSYFGHRAFVHAPITWRGRLYGILEPCVFETARVWSARDRALVEAAVAEIAEPTARHVARAVRRVASGAN